MSILADEVMLGRLRKEAAARATELESLRASLDALRLSFDEKVERLAARSRATLEGRTLESDALIATVQRVLTTETTALAERLDRMEARVSSGETLSTATLEEFRRAFATSEAALAEMGVSLIGTFDTYRARFEMAVTTLVTEDFVEAKATETLTAASTDASAQILAERVVREDAENVIAAQIESISTQVNDPATGLPEAHARITTDGTTRAALGDDLDALATQVATVEATANGASDAAGLASGAASAAVSTAATAQAGVNNLKSEYVLEVSTATSGNRRVAGFRITNEGGAGGATNFHLQADRVAITNGDGNNARAPFVVAGGQVFMDTAVIQDASIGSAKIANLAAEKISTGDLQTVNLSRAGLLYHLSHPSQKFRPVDYTTQYQIEAPKFHWSAGSGWSSEEISPIRLRCPGHPDFGATNTVRVCPDHEGYIRMMFNASIFNWDYGNPSICIYYRATGPGGSVGPVPITSNTSQFTDGSVRENAFRSIAVDVAGAVDLYLWPGDPGGSLSTPARAFFIFEATFFNW